MTTQVIVDSTTVAGNTASARALTKAERKRLQNRLNQEAYRRREAEKSILLEKKDVVHRATKAPRIITFKQQQRSPETTGQAKTSRRRRLQTVAEPVTISFQVSTYQGSVKSDSTSPNQSPEPDPTTVRAPENAITVLESLNTQARDHPIPKHIYWDWAVPHPGFISEEEIQALPRVQGLSSSLSQPPTPAFRFPLSADHTIMIIQYNMYRAMKTNKTLLLPWIPPCPHSGVVPEIPDGFAPPDLRPTAIQQVIAAPAWVSNFPHHKVRDNIILRLGDVCWDDMLTDLVGTLYPLHAQCERDDHNHLREGDYDDLSDVAAAGHGMIVWGEPWDFNNWELTPAFIRKWRWTLKGCQDLIDVSNRWRAQRNEPPIVEVLE